MALDINLAETTQLSANRLKRSAPPVIGSIARLCAFGIAAIVLPAQSAMTDSTRILPSPTITVSTIPANRNVNNLKQLGLELHNQNGNNLKQLGLELRNQNGNNLKQLGLEPGNGNVRTKFPKIDPEPNRPTRTLASRVGREYPVGTWSPVGR